MRDSRPPAAGSIPAEPRSSVKRGLPSKLARSTTTNSHPSGMRWGHLRRRGGRLICLHRAPKRSPGGCVSGSHRVGQRVCQIVFVLSSTEGLFSHFKSPQVTRCVEGCKPFHKNSQPSRILAAKNVVGLTGFEPATPTPPVWCATKLRHSPLRYR